VQIPRTRVVTKPGPFGEHLIERCIGERPHIRPARQEFAVVAGDSLDRRLLESRLPPAIFYNLLICARKPRRA